MKIQKILFAVLVLACSTQLRAQDYAFKVLVNKGKNEIKSGSGWQQIKVGSSLTAKDELKIAENSYLGLVHVTGKPLELKQSGQYKVLDLSSKMKDGPSVVSKYTDFILSANTGPKNTLTATGAVNRGPGAIPVFLPTSPAHVNVFGNTATIVWEDKAAKPYVVTFTSMFEDELYKVETNENSIVVNLDDKNFSNEDNIIVMVYSKTDKSKKSDKYTLKKLSKADKERMKTTLGDLSGQLTEETAMNKLMLAGVYEKNGLLIDALSYYLQAVKLAPDVPDFKEDYEAFLLRNNMKQPPAKK